MNRTLIFALVTRLPWVVAPLYSEDSIATYVPHKVAEQRHKSSSIAAGLLNHFAAATKLPEGWWLSWNAIPRPFDVGLDRAVPHAGNASGFVEAKTDDPSAGIWMDQGFAADAYRGKRLRLSGCVKTQDARRGANLWMLVGGRTTLAFDTMRQRRILGTTDWKKYEIVLDVPRDAVAIHFGFGLVAGSGKVWADDFQFEVVGQDVPTTELSFQRPAPLQLQSSAESPAPPLRPEPPNLDFEK
jgi:hypothetical protein